MERVIGAVAEAKKEGEAKLVSAKSELAASQVYAETSKVMSRNPTAMYFKDQLMSSGS